MHQYFLNGLEKKELYSAFIRYMINRSEEFSLVYFSYPNTRMKSSIRAIKESLAPFQLSRKETNIMPSMATLNEERGRYLLTYYRAAPDALDILERAGSLYEWDYPMFPMDLCFFREGYAWFISSAHERWNTLYTDHPETIRELETLGLTAEPEGMINDEKLFYKDKAYRLEDFFPGLDEWEKHKKNNKIFLLASRMRRKKRERKH